MRSVACLAVFGVLLLSAVSAFEDVTSEQALDILDTLQSSPDVLTNRKLLQHGPLSHQLAVCRAEAAKGMLCPIIAHYLSVCRKKFGVHTLKCSATTATACTSTVVYGISATGRCVCNHGYEHLKARCVACPPGKVKKDISYGYCTTCALGKYQPMAGQSQCIKCNIITHRVNADRSSCTLRSSVTPTPGTGPTPTPTTTPGTGPTPTPSPTPTPGAPKPPPSPAVPPVPFGVPPSVIKAPPSPPAPVMPPPAPLFR